MEKQDIKTKISTQHTSLIRSKSLVIMLCIALALVIATFFRWDTLGWEGMIWFAALLVMFAIRTPHSLANHKNVIIDERNDRIETLVLAGMFLAMMVLPLLYLATPILDFANYGFPIWASAIGALFQLPFLWLFWRSHSDLGRNWSPGLEVRDGHRLITQGIYAYVRHPMYAAMWISVFTQPLLLHNWIAGVLIIPAFIAMWIFRIPKEEAMMCKQFGEQYKDYQTRTGRVIPQFFSRKGRA